MSQCVVCSKELRSDARFCPSCGAEQPRASVVGSDADPLIGKTIARKFQIEMLLGVGGMGRVYKARQLSLDKAVVVKVLHDSFRNDSQLVQRFQREAKAASRLNHPNSIQIIDFGQDETGVVFMAMEFLQGKDLFSLLKAGGPLPAERIARIMIQVCSALADAHDHNVIHRDLKPENIMVVEHRGQRDFVKVLDFGIAKIQDPAEGQQQALTQQGMVCGTPEYMSPEQARDLPLDARSDIYALGIVMYQLAVGVLPFVAETAIGIVTKHILEKPRPPRDHSPHLNIPAAFEAVVLKAMEKDPAKRFASASEMGVALEQALKSFAPEASTFSSAMATSSRSAHVVASSSPEHTNERAAPGTPTVPPAAEGVGFGTRVAPVAVAGAGALSDLGRGITTETELVATGVVRPSKPRPWVVVVAAFLAVLVVGVPVLVGFARTRTSEAGPGSTSTSTPTPTPTPTPEQRPAAVAVDQGTGAAPTPGKETSTPADLRPESGETDVGATPPRDARVVDASAAVGGAPSAQAPGPSSPSSSDDAKATGATTDPPQQKEPRRAEVGNSGTGAQASRRAEAERLFRAAHASLVAGPCTPAVSDDLVKAAQLDTSFAPPLFDIALCAKQSGNPDAACSAAREYVRRKGLVGANAENTLATFCTRE